MAQKALFHNPDLVRIAPVSPTWHVRGKENFNFGSELMVGHKLGPSTDAKTPSDGLRRRDTITLTPPDDLLPWNWVPLAEEAKAVA
jgi:hypothetical protein